MNPYVRYNENIGNKKKHRAMIVIFFELIKYSYFLKYMFLNIKMSCFDYSNSFVFVRITRALCFLKFNYLRSFYLIVQFCLNFVKTLILDPGLD